MKIAVKIVLLLILVGLFSCKSNNKGTSIDDKTRVEMYQIEGIVLNIPSNKKVDLMLFSIDDQNKPQELLASKQYKGNGNAISFQLPFKLTSTNSFKRLEIRGRVIESGHATRFLTPWRKITKENLKGVILELNDES